ncbi:hypothetical protein BY996DRAFT_7086775 [Phakopsora pachyrhizi]|uniref:Expressed protein n=1 Tax=Phakopsora pachyrhizi TaxID=170000 RepID=A0AAV0ADG6_PHAPC|nr:hypothetical protein BY996DRAFT_7086775 [Phakopsora pachyrhizi]CAH7666065.1 expressed protein [Phakopsora pachyrhizi]
MLTMASYFKRKKAFCLFGTVSFDLVLLYWFSSSLNRNHHRVYCQSELLGLTENSITNRVLANLLVKRFESFVRTYV